MLGLSLLLVSRGLAASAPSANGIQVDPVKAQIDPPPPSAPAALPAPPPPPEFTETTLQPVLRQLVTPAGLRRLVTTLAAHPAPMRPEVECIARAVYREAANQALPGQLAVAQVIVNRARSGAFPKSICAVVGQPGQFSQNPVDPSQADSKPWDSAVAIATIAQQNRAPQIAPGALFFHAAYMRPAWSEARERIAQIGDHIFYR